LILLAGVQTLNQRVEGSSPSTPTNEIKDLPRNAEIEKSLVHTPCTQIRGAFGSDQEPHEAAVAAVQTVLTQLSWKEASAEALNAIAYATKYHKRLVLEGRAADKEVVRIGALAAARIADVPEFIGQRVGR
jgi:hypothetical protein